MTSVILTHEQSPDDPDQCISTSSWVHAAAGCDKWILLMCLPNQLAWMMFTDGYHACMPPIDFMHACSISRRLWYCTLYSKRYLIRIVRLSSRRIALIGEWRVETVRLRSRLHSHVLTVLSGLVWKAHGLLSSVRDMIVLQNLHQHLSFGSSYACMTCMPTCTSDLLYIWHAS